MHGQEATGWCGQRVQPRPETRRSHESHWLAGLCGQTHRSDSRGARSASPGSSRHAPKPCPPAPRSPSPPALLPGSGAVPRSASFLRKSWKNTSGIGVAFSGLLQRSGMKGPPAGTPPARLPPRGPRVHVSRLRLLRTQETCASTWDGHTDRTVRSHLRLCCRRPPRGRDHVLGAGAAPPRPAPHAGLANRLAGGALSRRIPITQMRQPEGRGAGTTCPRSGGATFGDPWDPASPPLLSAPHRGARHPASRAGGVDDPSAERGSE